MSPSGQVRDPLAMDTALEQCFEDGWSLGGAQREGKAFWVAETACARPPTLGSLATKSTCTF